MLYSQLLSLYMAFCLDHVCCNKNVSTVYIALDAEMLRLWEETDPFHQIDDCMDDVYAQLGDQVSID